MNRLVVPVEAHGLGGPVGVKLWTRWGAESSPTWQSGLIASQLPQRWITNADRAIANSIQAKAPRFGVLPELR